MNNRELLGPWIRRFLLEHIVEERNLSHNTQQSYRDALAMLLPFVAAQAESPLDRLRVIDLSESRVRAFLTHLEQVRKVSINTRNQRLASIHALARFISEYSPQHVGWAGEIRTVPFKKTMRKLVSYLEKPEVEALLAVPDRTTAQGQRNYALLLFLYNSGARASEAANLCIADLELATRPPLTASVRILGKGGKIRRCPLEKDRCGTHTTRRRAFATGEGVPEPKEAGSHPLRHPRADESLRRTCWATTAGVTHQIYRPTHNASLDSNASVAGRRRSEYDPLLARSCLARHNPNLRRGRSGDESEGSGEVQQSRSKKAVCSNARRPHALPAKAINSRYLCGPREERF